MTMDSNVNQLSGQWVIMMDLGDVWDTRIYLDNGQ